MAYAKIGNYNHHENLKFVLGFVLASVWVLTSFLYMYKVVPFQNFTVARSTGGSVNSGVVYASNIPKVNVGPATEDLIKKIAQTGQNPVVLGDINRATFSVEGKIVTMDGDNINIYEYSNNNVASDEVAAFQLSSETPTGSWKKDVNLYAKDNLIVFYMGQKQSIIKSLDNIFGQPVNL